ncbi:MAG: hypothetical protein NTY87_11245 [Planctomycetia bacterium]|nr:hypothetical protein [Planctomycetia bacterium]
MFKPDNASNCVLAHTSESYGGSTAPIDINYEMVQALWTRNKGETFSRVP